MLITCQKIEDRLPVASNERNAVLGLKNVLLRRKCVFSAAGFFQINRKTIFSLLSVVATYLVILFQFQHT